MNGATRSATGPPTDEWSPQVSPPTPLGAEVHLWTIDLREEWPDAEDILDAAEHAHAQRRDRRDRGSFVRTHAGVREILGAYVGKPARSLTFDRSPLGKPVLHGVDVSFSIAHSHELAVVAIAGDGPVGVDLERVRAIDTSEIGPLVLSAAELAQSTDAAIEDGLRTFFRRWTAKEALLKATGHGLRIAPSLVDVGTVDALRARVRHPADGRDWSVLWFSPAVGYVGAVAVRATSPVLRGWSWRRG